MTNENRIEVIKRLFNIAASMIEQQSGFHATTERVLNTKDLFDKLPYFLSSFIKVYETKLWNNHTDENTLSSIARNILELRNAFQYVNEYKLSKAEIEFRSFSMTIHADTREKEILEKLKSPIDLVKQRLGFGIYLIKKNSFFKSLSERDQKEVLSARKAHHWLFIKHRKQLINKHLESGLFDLLSNLTHSYPLSTIVRSPYRESSLFSHENVILLCHEIVIIYSSSIIRDYLALRSKVFLDLNRTERDFLKECKSYELILSLIENTKYRNKSLEALIKSYNKL